MKSIKTFRMERVYLKDLIADQDYLIYLHWNLYGYPINELVIEGRLYDYYHSDLYTYIEFLVKDQYGDDRIMVINSYNEMYRKPDRISDHMKYAILQRQQLIMNPKQTRDTKYQIMYHPICVFANPVDYFSSETIDQYGLIMSAKMREILINQT